MGMGSSFRIEPFILNLAIAVANYLNFLQQLHACVAILFAFDQRIANKKAPEGRFF
ncbi:hypothetical protein [Acidovorax sp. FHTAMBA]|jgi:hypothetical protein|uniref:hypothetical protein n=1 Tax=Acidovorax sp. FHTAMBA TaxID=3140252 RepID=UPI0015F4B487